MDLFTRVSVINVNETPIVTGVAVVPPSNEDTTVIITAAQLLAASRDPDAGDALAVVNLTASSGTVVSSGIGLWSFTPAANDDSHVTFSFGVTDGTFTVPATATLDLTPVNDAPSVGALITDSTIAEDAAFSYALPAGTFADVDSANLALTTSALPAWLSFNTATRTFSGTPSNANVGTVNVTVTASDGALSVSDIFAITVTNVNDAPTVAVAIVDQAATQGAPFSFTLPAGTFADVDAGDTLTFSATGVPTWLTFNAATRTFSGTPGAANVGIVNISVTATDGAGASVSDAFAINVASGGTPPIIGTNGGNFLVGTAGNDIINALDGNDVVFGRKRVETGIGVFIELTLSVEIITNARANPLFCFRSALRNEL